MVLNKETKTNQTSIDKASKYEVLKMIVTDFKMSCYAIKPSNHIQNKN